MLRMFKVFLKFHPSFSFYSNNLKVIGDFMLCCSTQAAEETKAEAE
jgi:hypothetical protein